MAGQCRDAAVTVAVATYRRPASLGRTLAGLAAQRGAPPWRLVVVDNDPAGSAGPVVRAAASLGVAVDYLVEPAPGSAAARNRAVAAVTTGLSALLDDDVAPAPDWLAAVCAPLLAGSADLVGGPVTLDPTVPRPRWFAEAGLGGYLTAFAPYADRRPLPAGGLLLTANLAVRTELLRAVGGFDPRLGPRGGVQLVGDDASLVRRLVGAGARAWYEPAATVVHELPAARLRPRYLLRRAYWQGRSDWRLDEESLAARRGGGSRVAGSWLAGQLRRRAGEGLARPEVAFHAACDLARTGGALREAAALTLRNRRRAEALERT